MLSVGFLLCLTWLPFAIMLGGRPVASEDELIDPIPAREPADPEKVALGKRLFHDSRLSHGDVVACVSCHRLDQGGDDGQARSVAPDGTLLDFNTPTIFNVARNFRFNWRGNFRTLEEQNESALFDQRLMNTRWEELLPKLRADTDYRRDFTAAYGAGPDRERVLDALAIYQRSLTTPNAPFDRYLAGEADAISADEKEGYRLFNAYGCTACHQGVNVGGNLFQRFGIFANPFAEQETQSQADLGRFTVTGKESDRHVFRVPSLRNVVLTAPYFHDGRTASLEEAVEIMGRNQLGRDLTGRDVDLIVKFLGTLTGEQDDRAPAIETHPTPP